MEIAYSLIVVIFISVDVNVLVAKDDKLYLTLADNNNSLAALLAYLESLRFTLLHCG